MKGYTFYAKNTGIEVTTATNVRTEKGGSRKEGRIRLRFFDMNTEKDPVYFMLNPSEAFAISRGIARIEAGELSTFAVKHQFEKNGEELVTTLFLERWERNGKGGFAASIKRNGDSINVALSVDDLGFLGHLLGSLSTAQAWFSFEATTTSPEPESDNA